MKLSLILIRCIQEVSLKNPIKNYIETKNANLSLEEKQKREEMAQLLTRELELLVRKKDEDKRV